MTFIKCNKVTNAQKNMEAIFEGALKFISLS